MDRVALILSTVALFACIEDRSSSPDGINSGVQSSRTVSSLSDAEARSICSATHARGISLIDKQKNCELTAVMITDNAQGCRELTDLCVQGGDDSWAEERGCYLNEAERRMGCEETVEAMEICTAAVFDRVTGALNSISCDDAGDAETIATWQASVPTVHTVPDCEAIVANCPALYPSADMLDE